ncbi:MAG TPA: CRTAC1 family protein, partial [Saprospiraceae bacterium]|nr:CRTAC1 family protein [Saprospiraceae bacterium]
MQNYVIPLLLSLLTGFTACKSKSDEADSKIKGPQRFEILSGDKTGITFSNILNEDYTTNIFNYEYLYNGGGVAIGDINNDGLPDIYFSSTRGSNKLYLNKGGLKFEDITDRAGVVANIGFKTGITMADVNGDGLLDIFVCRTNKDSTQLLGNLLYINNGNLTFSDKTKEYGLDDKMNTNHAVFLDYDGDGDLDLFIMNHKVNFIESTSMRLRQRTDGSIYRETYPLTSFESDRLYRNDNNHFVNVSKQAGIATSAFSLSATVADINLDNYPDIYVAHDYIEPDLILINNKKGGFEDKCKDYLKHMTQNSMGSDVADFNNDGLPDIVSLDMAAEDPFRYKQMLNTLQFERYNFLLNYGYGHQISRNMLQLNNGNNTFSDIGQLAGISNTDWSWGATFNDFDNDGWKDIYITNGYPNDVTDNDYMIYTRDSIELSGGVNQKRFPDINQVFALLPSNKLPNYMYRNKADLTFENATEAWGMKIPSFSNGYAVGDLDGDGDLDIVVNNIKDPAFVFENKTVQQGDMNFLQIKLNGPPKNRFGLGTKVWLWSNGQMQYQELYTNRGFLSSSELLIHFGLGKFKKIDRVEVRWPDGRSQILSNVNANQRLKLNYSDAGKEKLTGLPIFDPMFNDISKSTGIDFLYKDSLYIDFNNERLIPHKFSNQGPFITKGDVNNDGKEDIYIGGAAGQPGVMYLQTDNGKFIVNKVQDFINDKGYED